MLPKSYRLPVSPAPRRHGKRFGSPLGTLIVLPAETAHVRCGITVGRVVDRRAVVRNRIRRTFFLAAEHALAALPICDYLFIASPPIGKLSKQKLSAAFAYMFAQTLNSRL